MRSPTHHYSQYDYFYFSLFVNRLSLELYSYYWVDSTSTSSLTEKRLTYWTTPPLYWYFWLLSWMYWSQHSGQAIALLHNHISQQPGLIFIQESFLPIPPNEADIQTNVLSFGPNFTPFPLRTQHIWLLSTELDFSVNYLNFFSVCLSKTLFTRIAVKSWLYFRFIYV